MLHFTFGDTATFALTLSELATLGSGVYYFRFTRRVPGQVISFTKEPDASTERADEFSVDVDTLFAGAAIGQYTYEVFETAALDDVEPTGESLEVGVMELYPETAFTFIQRQSLPVNYIYPA